MRYNIIYYFFWLPERLTNGDLISWKLLSVSLLKANKYDFYFLNVVIKDKDQFCFY